MARLLTSISLSVRPKQCPSCSCELLNVEDLHRPPKPMSSRLALSMSVESSTCENLELELRVCSSSCAASSVDEFWQWSRTSSKMEAIGAHLVC